MPTKKKPPKSPSIIDVVDDLSRIRALAIVVSEAAHADAPDERGGAMSLTVYEGIVVRLKQAEARLSQIAKRGSK